MNIMEKKYPVLKCNDELWNEIKPVLESFDINKFNITETVLHHADNYIVSNFGSPMENNLIIGNTIYYPREIINEYSRYLVNTKEEFLSAVAKLLGKEYPIKKEQIEQSSEVKYPYIKCSQQLYDRIKDILEIIGYTIYVNKITESANELVIDYANNFGDVANLLEDCADSANRYRCSNIQEFLITVCELKGFEVVYNIFVKDNNAENHYFKYVIDKENKIIEISETYNNEGECSATVTHKKKFKKKRENYVVSYDPAVGKDNTVITTMPAKGNDFDKDKGSDLDIDKNKDMEKINIADKLKYCKVGTKLYSPIFGEVEFNYFDNNHIWVKAVTCENIKVDIVFTRDGEYYDCYPNAECLLFPSKDNRDWNNFQVLEKGHLVMCADYEDTWQLRKYISDNIAGVTNSNFENESASWRYIVPIEDFDFTAENITINKEKSIV